VARRLRLGAAIVAAGLATILFATLYPVPNMAALAAQTPLLCLVCGPNGGADVFLNLVLFVPFAIGLRLSGWSWKRATLACALVSFGVELLQFLGIPGRDASLSDLIFNTLGGSVAAGLTPLFPRALDPDRKTAWRLTLIGAALFLAFFAFAVWLFTPWTARGPVRSQWAHESSLHNSFTGKIRSVVVWGDSLANEVPVDAARSDRIREAFRRETIDIRLELVSQPPTPSRAWLYRLGIRRGKAIVSQQGRALVFEVPRRLAALRIFNPSIRLDDAVPAAPGEAFRIAAGERDSHLWLESTEGGRTRRAELHLTPTMVWGLVIPFHYAFGPEAGLLTMLWVGVLLVPLGYWSARSGRPLAASIVVGLALAGAFGLMPRLGGMDPMPWREWIAAAAGFAAGWAGRGPAAYLASRCGSPSVSESSSS
jgi:VanZ like protein